MELHESVFAQPEASQQYLSAKLAWYVDAWDLAEWQALGDQRLVVIDVRSATAYSAGHLCGAINFPHRLMSAAALEVLDKDKLYVTYCDGIGCNGSTKGALRLASAGYRVKELIGGLDFWRRDDHPIVTGDHPGTWPSQVTAGECGC